MVLTALLFILVFKIPYISPQQLYVDVEHDNGNYTSIFDFMQKFDSMFGFIREKFRDIDEKFVALDQKFDKQFVALDETFVALD